MASKKSKKVSKKLVCRKLRNLLEIFSNSKATNLFLIVGAPPMLKRTNALEPIGKVPLTPEEILDSIYLLLTPKQKEILESGKELDICFGIRGMARFRGNIYCQRGSLAAAFTLIPFHIPTWKEINGPKNILPLLDKKNGLIIITGPSGSGKTTITASLVDYINSTYQYHIVTIEDPIEYLIKHKKSIVTQRHVGYDTESFKSALYHVLRQAPDVVVLSELRDVEMICTALTLAEVGCLCITQLHAPYTASALEKMIRILPSDTREIVRSRLADNFLCAIASRLFPKKKGRGLIPAYEILINNEKVKKLIEVGEFAKLKTHLKPSLKASIRKLKREGKIAL